VEGPVTQMEALDVRVLGVDACKGGWVGVALRDGRFDGAYIAGSVGALHEAAAAAGHVAVVGIDMAIGLPDASIRQAVLLARRRVGRLGSSVFLIPVRGAVEIERFADAVAHNRKLAGVGISIQAHGLRIKLLEVDAWVRSSLVDGDGDGPRVVEIHPEVVFAFLNGEPLTLNKRSWGGMNLRRSLLARSGVDLPGMLGGAERAGIDDVLDAAAVAWSAHRVATGGAQSAPDPPERFSDGLQAAVWF
jgi:predicted RNase H-like nuclease